MLFVILFVIVSLVTIGVVETRTTDRNPETRTTDTMPHMHIQSFEDWCAQHPEQEAVERPSLFMPLPELTNGLQHIDIPSFDEWCEHHIVDTDGDRPSLFMPVADLTNSLPGLGGTTFTQWCDEHPIVECEPVSKVCALEVRADTIVEPVAWIETDHDFNVLRDVLTKYTEDPTEQEQITWDIWCILSSAIPKKVAEDVMANMTVGEILAAAADKNANAFRKVVGVGPKRAALIVSCLYEFWTEHGLSF